MIFTVGKKLALGFGSVLTIMAISGIAVIMQLDEIGSDLHQIVDVTDPISDAAYEMEINLIGTGFGLLGYLEDRDPVHQDRITEDVG